MTLTISETSSSNLKSMEKEALPTADLQLLAKLEAANKLIESDSKSLNSLQGSAHSRKSSDTSQISLNSGKMIRIENTNGFSNTGPFEQ